MNRQLPFSPSGSSGMSCPGGGPSDPCGGEGYQGSGSCQAGSAGHVPKAVPGTSNCVGSPPVGLYACPIFEVAGNVPGSVPVSQI